VVKRSCCSFAHDIKLSSNDFREWTDYAINLAHQLGIKGIQGEEKLGKNLKESNLDQFNDEQVTQLHELYLASKGKHDS
jgi:hypothetical protein